MNLKVGHFLGSLLIGGAYVMQFLQTRPELATELHLSQGAMLLIGTIIVAAEDKLFGSVKVPPTAGGAS